MKGTSSILTDIFSFLPYYSCYQLLSTGFDNIKPLVSSELPAGRIMAVILLQLLPQMKASRGDSLLRPTILPDADRCGAMSVERDKPRSCNLWHDNGAITG